MPNSGIIQQLLSQYALISDQVDDEELAVILSELQYAIAHTQNAGAVVEFGCYIGTTSLFIRRLLDSLGSPVDFHVYDSFTGLPEKSLKDQSPAGEQFRAGELTASRKLFELQFKKAGLRKPIVHKGWFRELEETSIPDAIVFAYLDGDYYDSITDSLKLIWPKLLPGARVVVDDYANEALPGARRAVDEWLMSHSCKLRIETSLAIMSDCKA